MDLIVIEGPRNALGRKLKEDDIEEEALEEFLVYDAVPGKIINI